MHRPGQFLRQGRIDLTLAFHATDARKGCTDDHHAEMRVTRAGGSSVACMAMGFVLDLQPRRRECFGQLAAYRLFCRGHGPGTLRIDVLALALPIARAILIA